jgi:hypothetical protein
MALPWYDLVRHLYTNKRGPETSTRLVLFAGLRISIVDPFDNKIAYYGLYRKDETTMQGLFLVNTRTAYRELSGSDTAILRDYVMNNTEYTWAMASKGDQTFPVVTAPLTRLDKDTQRLVLRHTRSWRALGTILADRLAAGPVHLTAHDAMRFRLELAADTVGDPTPKVVTIRAYVLDGKQIVSYPERMAAIQEGRLPRWATPDDAFDAVAERDFALWDIVMGPAIAPGTNRLSFSTAVDVTLTLPDIVRYFNTKKTTSTTPGKVREPIENVIVRVKDAVYAKDLESSAIVAVYTIVGKRTATAPLMLLNNGYVMKKPYPTELLEFIRYFDHDEYNTAEDTGYATCRIGQLGTGMKAIIAANPMEKTAAGVPPASAVDNMIVKLIETLDGVGPMLADRETFYQADIYIFVVDLTDTTMGRFIAYDARAKGRGAGFYTDFTDQRGKLVQMPHYSVKPLIGVLLKLCPGNTHHKYYTPMLTPDGKTRYAKARIPYTELAPAMQELASSRFTRVQTWTGLGQLVAGYNNVQRSDMPDDVAFEFVIVVTSVDGKKDNNEKVIVHADPATRGTPRPTQIIAASDFKLPFPDVGLLGCVSDVSNWAYLGVRPNGKGSPVATMVRSVEHVDLVAAGNRQLEMAGEGAAAAAPATTRAIVE